MFSSIIWVIVFIGILIIFHEFGHLVAAKLSHIPVEVFSVGFGPVILKKKLGETEYRVSVIPLGGFIKMVGEEEKAGPRPDSPAPAPTGGYMDKPLGVKVAVIAAGPVSNLVLGFLILLVVFAGFGQQYSAPVISLDENSAAFVAGLRPGDTVVAVNGETVPSFDAFDARIARDAGRQVTISVRRDGRRLDMPMSVPIGYIDSLIPAIVGEVMPGGPASAAAITKGDTLTAVAGTPVRSWPHFTELVRRQTSGPYTLSWRRDGVVYTDTLRDSITTDPGTGTKINLAGISVSTDWYISPYIAAVVGSVRKDGPASRIGLRPGDSIVEFADVPIGEWADFADAVYSRGGETVPIVWQRAGQMIRRQVTVGTDEEQILGQRGGGIGISARVPRRKLNLPNAIVEAAVKTGTVTAQTYVVLYKSITVKHFARRALGGPIMVARIAYEGASWGWDYFLLLFAILSINLFVVNLLPVPVLDGGRIVLDCIAGIRRRNLTERELNWAAGIGWAMVGALVLFTIFNDILKLIRK
ncbi:RIP metalloprotease RseP [candidate division WOR-3 bacterium]|nr:RIP metalloprotease RseP [candidate division WOR-3 bacterium]